MLTFAAFVEATKFCSKILLLVEGTKAVLDCGSIGYAAQYSVPALSSTELTTRDVLVAVILRESTFGAGSKSLKFTLSSLTAEVRLLPAVLQVEVTQEDIVYGLTLPEAVELAVQ